MWNGRVLMISLSGLGEATGDGETAGVGESAGVGEALGVVTGDGVASGEFEACWLGCVQPARTKTKPATQAAGITALLTKP
jgi:hypothetical protein